MLALNRMDEAREKARLARGVLVWKLDSEWKVRSWQANRALRELNATVYDARTRETASGRAREGAPEKNAALGQRVEHVAPRIVALAVRVETRRRPRDAALPTSRSRNSRTSVSAWTKSSHELMPCAARGTRSDDEAVPVMA